MAINKNHEFEDLSGVKCAIVEKNVPKARVDFLVPLLEHNGYQVVVVPTPVAAPKAAPVEINNEIPASPTPPPAPETFTVGVTDVRFNAINAIFGRLLRTPGGHVVTLAFWKQEEKAAHDEVPYFEFKR